MGKKEELLGNTEYELTIAEKNQLNAIIEMVNQARMAQDILYTNLVQSIASRYEVAQVELNIDEVMEKGTDVAKIIVKG